MEFSTEVIQGIKYLGDNNLNISNFKRIIDSALKLILEEDKFERVGQICPDKRDVVEAAYAAVLTIAVHFVQSAASKEILIECLNNCGLKEERVDYIATELISRQYAIAAKLSNIKSSPPRIVDVNWKLDYIVKSSSKYAIGEAQYLLLLTTEKNGKFEHIRFTCDQFQLQGLSTSLKQIIHQAEKFASS